ncbi:MAG: hypothetical protein QXO67_01255 [Candidatus Bathyarchaeia archaeon]
MELASILSYDGLIRDFWQQWFTVEASLGREIFQGSCRVWIDSFSRFHEYVAECKAKGAPCWLTVQPFKKHNQPAMVEKLYFDFDYENLREAWREASTFAAHIKRFYEAEPLICFSGNKGYNIYVWLQTPFKLEDQSQLKRFYKTAQSMLLKGLKFKTLDKQPLGDIKRFSRVPYSIHQKTRNPCVPIYANHTPILISELSVYREHGLNGKFIDLCQKQLRKPSEFKRLKTFTENGDKIRPCIKAALEKSLEGHSGHLMRLAVAREFLTAGYTVEDIIPLFQNQSDFDPEKTRYYVENARKTPAKPFKCQTIRELGFCLPDCFAKSEAR